MGSRFKGYEEITVQDLIAKAETTLYRRERWETPDGKTLIAPLAAGIVGGCGPHLHRLVLMLHFEGQMPCERIVAFLAGLGLAISKRQVLRLLAAKLDGFRAEDEAVLRAGLAGAPFVTVDDTGARHAGKACFTTHIGSDRFAAFRTGPGKSRLAFLSRLLGGAARYVINAAAIAYMRRADLPQDVIDRLAGHASRDFGSHAEWTDYLRALGIADLRVAPDPVRLSSEAALWGAIEAEGDYPFRIGKPRACSSKPSSSPTTPASSASAITRCVGCMPSASSTSSFPPTTNSATPSRSPSAWSGGSIGA